MPAKKKVASQGPASRKPEAAPRRPARTGKKTAAAAATATTGKVDARRRYEMIQEAAYYIAEKHGFKKDPAECWIAAEKQINGRT